jgi:isochorismate hydrolase
MAGCDDMPAKKSARKSPAAAPLSEKVEEWKRRIARYESGHRKKAHPFSYKKSALLVVDMQRYFFEKSSHAFIEPAPAILPNVRRILDDYRRLGLPVIFTRHAYAKGEDRGMMDTWWSELEEEGDPLAEVVDELKPLPKEPVLRKGRYSAFVGTDLEKRLRKLGVERVLITGVMTHLCCESTARDAFMKDFEVFFTIDGTASENDELHVASLMTLTDGFAMPITAEEVLRCLK